MYTLVLMVAIYGKPAMTSVEKVASMEQCQSMGQTFSKAISPIWNPQFVCLPRG